MNYCYLHRGKIGHYKCNICKNNLCFGCFHKYQVKFDRIKIGFCSERCKSIYIERIKEFKSKNRKKSFKFFLFGSVTLILGLVRFNSFLNINEVSNLEQAFNKTVITILFEILILSGITQIALGFWALFKGYDPDMYS